MDEKRLPRLPKVHIGEIIREELERQERSVSWLARKLYCDRTNVYKIFRRSTIDTDLLMRISVALEHDFFCEYVRIVENSMVSDAEVQTAETDVAETDEEEEEEQEPKADVS